LEKRIKLLEIQVMNVDDFVEQNSYYNETSDNFQNERDKIDMYG
jgi:hypothetical protein